MVTRVVEVPADRLAGWVERYAATHPGTRVTIESGGVRLTTSDAAEARLVPLLPYEPVEPVSAEHLIAALAVHAQLPVVTALLLIRRGGYAVGVATGPRLTHSKVGSRYVQSRTAAGGWSQQRFARRREGQAKELVRAAASAWAELGDGSGSAAGGGAGRAKRPTVLVTGGDRALCEAVRAEPELRSLRQLPVARHLDVPDPRLAILQQAAQRTQALLVTISEP